MGLLKELLLLPAAPVRGTFWVLEQVVAQAEQQYYDPRPFATNSPCWRSS